MEYEIRYFMRGVCAFFIILLSFSLVFAQQTSTEGFDLNSLLLKVSLTQGEQVSKVLTVSRGLGQQINLELNNVPGVKLSEDSFVLQSQESKNVQVSFDSKNLSPGVYAGNIKVSDKEHVFILPVIFEVESEDLFYDSNLDIPPQYSTISPGEKLVAQLKIFDLTWGGITQGLGQNNVNVEYNIYDINGQVVSSESETLVIDRQTQITKTVSFPESIQKGDYVFTVIVKYKSSTGVASYLFSIADSERNSTFFSGTFDWKFFSILAVIVVIFAGIIWFFVYMLKDRDALIMQMRKYNDSDFKKQRDFIKAQERAMLKKGVPAKVVKREAEHKIRVLRKNHKKRAEAVKKLVKKGNVQEMQNQLNQWKEKGYDTIGLEYKMKSLSSDDMKKILSGWKKEYGGEEYKKS